MSLYVLDTDMLTLLQHNHPVVYHRVKAKKATELATTVITVEEQLTGWYTRLRRAKKQPERARAYQDLANSVRGLSGLNILPFPETAMMRFADLISRKLNVGRKDLAIAAIAQELGATVVSRNLRDFQRVPGLLVEDWSV